MPAIFLTFMKAIIPTLLNWTVGKLSSWVTKTLKARRERKDIEQLNEALRKKSENAQTKEERESAATDTIRHI